VEKDTEEAEEVIAEVIADAVDTVEFTTTKAIMETTKAIVETIVEAIVEIMEDAETVIAEMTVARGATVGNARIVV
jgi:hypothetical protein